MWRVASTWLCIVLAASAGGEREDARQRSAVVPFVSWPAGVAYDAGSGAVYLSTHDGLYRADLHAARPAFAEIRLPCACRVQLSATGGTAALLHPGEDALATVQLFDLRRATPGPWLVEGGARLRARHVKPMGDGETLLTYLPLDDVEGVHGRWSWTFWDSGGKLRGGFTSDRDLPFILGPRGRTIAFRTRRALVVRSRSGGVVREIPGSYRAAALSADGDTVLLVPVDLASRLVLVRGGDRDIVDAGMPVRGVALSPDGTDALAWYRDGSLVRIDPATGRVGEPFRLPVDNEVAVTSVRLADGGIAGAAFAERTGSERRWDDGRVAFVRDGRVVWHRRFPTDTITASIPAILWVDEDGIVARNEEIVAFYPNPAPGGPR